MNHEFKNDDMNDMQDETAIQKIKKWTQENIRIIVSILIVFLIASSIYSYSKRDAQQVTTANKNNDVEKILNDLSSDKNEDVDETEATVSDTAESTSNSTTENSDNDKSANKTDEVAEKTDDDTLEKKSVDTDATPKQEKLAEKTPSQETESSFIESASRGDSLTKLARKALSHYLEKNPDSSLTPEHKIYIEDYLRKNANFNEKIYVGTSVEFSKSLIKNAIDASKNLNNDQLNNLHKYAINVQF